MRSGEACKLILHESFQIPPLESATEANQNDRLKSSQVFPGAISRKFWSLMQNPDTRDRKLFVYFNLCPHFYPII